MTVRFFVSGAKTMPSSILCCSVTELIIIIIFAIQIQKGWSISASTVITATAASLASVTSVGE